MSSQPQTQTDPTNEKGRRPTHRLWWVQDDGDEKEWTEVTGLWPTRSGKGLHASVPDPLLPAFLNGQPGRFVVHPAKFKDEEAQDDPPAPDQPTPDQPQHDQPQPQLEATP